MKKLIFLLAALTILNPGCTKKFSVTQGLNKAMLMDSSYANDKNVTVVHAKDTIHLVESMKNFDDNPNIAQTDIDAGERIESDEVHYVKAGETLRIAESDLKKK